MMKQSYSMRSPAVKRLMKEAQELREPTEQYFAQPLEDNLFEWHFTIRGPVDSEFDSGIYHGRIVLPPDYPMKPPSIILLTPNGRFEVFKKICLSISGHHPESWQPSWSIRTALLAIIGFMPTHGAGAIGSLDYSPEERKILAKKSQEWKCSTCGNVSSVLKPVTAASEKTRQEAKELATQIAFQGEKEKKNGNGAEEGNSIKADAQATPDSAAATSSPVFPQNMAFPPPAGAFPFNRFPFPPHFMNYSNMTQTQPSNVPRFPPPFFPPMFPPGFLPQAGGSSPMPMPPWLNMQGANQNNIAVQQTTSVPSPSQPSPRPQTDTQASPQSSSTEQTSSSVQNSIPPQASPETSQTPNVVPTTGETTVRQRVTQNQNVNVSENLSQRAELHHYENRDQSGGTVTLVLIIVLGLFICLLLLNRIYNSNMWKKYFDL